MINIKTLSLYKRNSKIIHWSIDHNNIHSSLAAIFGVVAIEKHFTNDKEK